MLILVVPEFVRRSVAVGDDAFNAETDGIDQCRLKLNRKMLGKVHVEIGIHIFSSPKTSVPTRTSRPGLLSSYSMSTFAASRLKRSEPVRLSSVTVRPLSAKLEFTEFYFRLLQYFFDSSTGTLCSRSTSFALLVLPHPKIFSNNGNSRLFCRLFWK